MCMKENKGATALKLLRIAKSLDNQFWWFQSPLRHFDSELKSSIQSIEAKILGNSVGNYAVLDSTLSLLEMTPEEVGQLCKSKKIIGKNVQGFIRSLPILKVACRVVPVTSHILRFHVRIDPDFKWQGRWHGGALSFWVWVEDSTSNRM